MSQEPHAAPCWEAIDGIVLINLDRRPDRLEHFMAEVGSRLPADRLYRLSATVGVDLPGYGEGPWFTERTGDRSTFWGGTGGCALSHRRALELARSKGWSRVLILEDDVEMGEVSPEYGRLLEQVLRQLRGPYLLYLGYNKPRPYGRMLQQEGSCSLWKIGGVIALHSYIVSAELYEPLLAVLPTPDTVWEWLSRYRAVDTFYCDFISNLKGVPTYTLLPHLFCQAGMESSITVGSSVGEGFRCDLQPEPTGSAGGLLHWLSTPFRHLKIRLNSLRTRLRARRGGLPGRRKRK